jgi:branched-chain amino acid transport system ATP-binding protein
MLSPSPSPLLAIDGLQAWYGESHVLHGATFEVLSGEVVTLLGRNGAGKTTTLKSIMGIVGQRAGSVRYDGREIIAFSSDRIARLGIALCPEERGIFSSLNVEENLLLPPKVLPGGLDRERIFELFPNLKERLSSQGTKLSGGEQQMLAMGRAIMSRPKLLLLDEPSMGLAPLMVQKVFETVLAISGEGVTILLIEQNAKLALEVSNRGYVMESGTITLSGDARDLLSNPKVREAYLGESV